MSLKHLPKPGVETAVALIGTAFSAMLLVLTAMYAGPLWRDEVNTAQYGADALAEGAVEQPAVRVVSAPLAAASARLWLSGINGQRRGIRVLGLYVGLFFLASLWLCSRWMGGRAPDLEHCVAGLVCRRLSSSWERTGLMVWRVVCWCSVSE